jgi:hypothetical protein
MTIWKSPAPYNVKRRMAAGKDEPEKTWLS